MASLLQNPRTIPKKKTLFGLVMLRKSLEYSAIKTIKNKHRSDSFIELEH